MSMKVMSHVWDNAPFEGSTLLTLLALADWSSDEGVCWPRLSSLMKKTRLGERTTYQAIRELISGGWLRKEKENKRVFYLVGNLANLADFDLANSAKIPGKFCKTPTPPYRKNPKEPSVTDAVHRVFAYYLQEVGRSEKLYTLTPHRMQQGTLRLKECMKKTNGNICAAEEMMGIAIDEMTKSDFHMGRESSKKKFNDWDILFRSSETLEKWLAKAAE